MKKLLSLVLAVILSLSLISCGGTTNDSKVIRIGVFEPQTGENGGGGLQEVYGIRYANSMYNKIKIGDETYDVELYEVDNKSDKTEAVRAAQRLVSEKVVAVVGSYGSGVSIAAGEIFKEAKVPAMGCSCTNPQVTNGNEYYFRTCFLDPFQGTVMANYCENHGYKKVAVISQLGDDYSKGLSGYFIKACNEKGIEVVAETTFQTGEQDFSQILTEIKAKDPQFIFAPSSIQTAPLIISKARELGITAQIGGGDTWENETIIENSHGHAEGIVVTTFYEADPEKAVGEEAIFLKGNGSTTKGFYEFLKSSKATDLSIAAVSALGYDAYLAVFKAIEKAQSLDGNAIRDAIQGLSFTGVTGDISFNADGDVNKKEAVVKEVKDSKFRKLETVKIN